MVSNLTIPIGTRVCFECNLKRVEDFLYRILERVRDGDIILDELESITHNRLAALAPNSKSMVARRALECRADNDRSRGCACLRGCERRCRSAGRYLCAGRNGSSAVTDLRRLDLRGAPNQGHSRNTRQGSELPSLILLSIVPAELEYEDVVVCSKRPVVGHGCRLFILHRV